jgi:pSer/pThr/pTyr-binding forkhead associated (FHA) protein
MPTITLKLKDKILSDHSLHKGIALTIGRRSKNDLVIDDLAVSGHHAKIDSINDGFVLIDLQSKNGSFVNEQLVHSHWLKDGDIINIGEHSLLFNHAEKEKNPSQDTEEFERTMVLDTSQYRSRMRRSNPTKSINNVAGFWDKRRNRTPQAEKKINPPKPTVKIKKELLGSLIYLAGGKGEMLLDRKYTTIGKHPASNIVVKGLFMGQTAVTISNMTDGFHLCHVGGLTKPKVNGKTIKQSIILNNEDIIKVGPTKLQFVSKNSSNH